MDDLLETVKKARERQRKCCLLIGAGCSVNAGVPLASEFVDVIKDGWPMAYQQADHPKQYPQCMAELSLSDRRHLIGRYVDNAKINWGHVAIAQLMKEGYVDRVLTTNFDQLVVRACAMVRHCPAVYDFAASQVLKPAEIVGDAVFYLHGQRNGFVLMNTERECADHSKKLAHLFEETGQGRVWIVVGYSGESDPVFRHLANVKSFDNKLFWIGFKDSEPANHVREQLLQTDKYAFHVKGFDADDFFVTLAQRLDCFPPRLVSQPFAHLNDLFQEFTYYKDPNQEQAHDITDQARTMVRAAVEEYENPTDSSEPRSKTRTNSPSIELQAIREFMAGHYENVIQLAPRHQHISAEHAELISWSNIALGNVIISQAQQKSAAEIDPLFSLAFEKFAAALKIKADMYQALYHWGSAFIRLAEQKPDAEAGPLFMLAAEKFEATLRIRPDMHQALNNWGAVLSNLAKQKSNAEADLLFALAGEKFEAALRIKQDKHEALYNWGSALNDQGRRKSGIEAERLFALASEKFEAALLIAPTKHEALYSWGIALSNLTTEKPNAEAQQLFALAAEKFEATLRIKPDDYRALYNWGDALSSQAQHKSGTEADRLFDLAAEKFEAALRIKPDAVEAFNYWGKSLSYQARHKSDAEAGRLFALAAEKFEAALRIEPDSLDAINNWGNSLCFQARRSSGMEADRLFTLAASKFEAALSIKVNMHQALNNWGNAINYQAAQKSGAEADKLFAVAAEKLEAAVQIKPEMVEALNNWGMSLSGQASHKSGIAADQLFALAAEKFSAALQIRPDMLSACTNWGIAFAEQAKQKSGAEADRLFALAYQKFEAASRIEPSQHDTLANWGIALTCQAKQKSGADAERLFADATEKLLRVEALLPGECAYNLACVSALQGREQECRAWLERSQACGQLPSSQHLLDDEDLMSVQSKDWFQPFVVVPPLSDDYPILRAAAIC